MLSAWLWNIFWRWCRLIAYLTGLSLAYGFFCYRNDRRRKMLNWSVGNVWCSIFWWTYVKKFFAWTHAKGRCGRTERRRRTEHGWWTKITKSWRYCTNSSIIVWNASCVVCRCWGISLHWYWAHGLDVTCGGWKIGCSDSNCSKITCLRWCARDIRVKLVRKVGRDERRTNTCNI